MFLRIVKAVYDRVLELMPGATLIYCAISTRKANYKVFNFVNFVKECEASIKSYNTPLIEVCENEHFKEVISVYALDVLTKN